MSKRGTALKGKDKGIYEKTLKNGQKRYTVRITFIRDDGTEGCKTETVHCIKQARKLREFAKAKRTTGSLSQSGSKKKITLREMTEKMRDIKASNKHSSDNMRYLDEILAFFNPECSLETIDEKKINTYRKHLDLQECKPPHSGLLSNRSKDHRLSELRSLLNEAHERKLLEHVPKIPLYGNYGEREYELNLEHFQALLDVLPGAPKPHKAILLLCLTTGMRRSDLLAFSWKQYQNGRIRFRSSKTQKKDFVVSAPKQLHEEMMRLWNHQHSMGILCEYAFLNPKTGKPYTDLKKPLETASKKIGLLNPATLHMFRHLAGDQVAQVTGNEMFTQKYIGWSSPEMVRRYTHIETWTMDVSRALEAKLEAVNKGA